VVSKIDAEIAQTHALGAQVVMLREQLGERDSHVSQLERNCRELLEKVEELEGTADAATTFSRSLRDALEERGRELAASKRAEASSRADLNRLRAELVEKSDETVRIAARIDAAELAAERAWNERESYRIKLEKTELFADAQARQNGLRIARLEKRLEVLDATLFDRTALIETLRSDLRAKVAEAANLSGELEAVKQAADERLDLLNRNDEHFRAMRAELEERIARGH
jgi:chromosome segregation ATPase